jgi:hypothetical protein
MKTARLMAACAAGLALSATPLAHAQDDGAESTVDASRPARLPTFPPVPPLEPPPQDFATAEAHYLHLLEAAGGGTEHTIETVPQWGGLWTSGGNTMASLFLEIPDDAPAWRTTGLPVREGVLTPPYEAQFRARRDEMEEYGEQRYDRLTNCEYPGVPRWLWEPYVKEFVNLPHQSWMMNDMMNETRRVYIGAEHVNIEGTHSPTGDSIGFWDGDKLVVWTKWVYPADYVRGMPLTSNQFEMVETWSQNTTEDGSRQLVTQVTFYDPLALVRPLSAVYTHNVSAQLQEAGVRIRNWECATSSNSYKDEEGNTQFHLPGDPEYKDPRAFTDFPDLPGQSRDPLFEPAADAP